MIKIIFAVISTLFLVSCTSEPAKIDCTVSISINVESWCAPELWDVPITASYDGEVIGTFNSKDEKAGPFKFNTCFEDGCERLRLSVGNQPLESTYLSCNDISKTTDYDYTLSGFKVETIGTPGRTICQGVECLQFNREKKRNCLTDFHLIETEKHNE